MSRSAIERKLRSITTEVLGLRSEVRVLNEQIDHFSDVADAARMRSLVAETHQAGAEYRSASRTLDVMVKNRDEMLTKIASLEVRQDELLDALSQQS